MRIKALLIASAFALSFSPLSLAQAPPASINYAPTQAAGYAVGVNFNLANSDTAIAVVLPTGFTRYSVASVKIGGASAPLTSSTAGLYTAVPSGGIQIAATQAVTVSTSSDGTNNNLQSLALTLSASFTASGYPYLYFHVGTAQGSAATGNVFVQLALLP